MKKHRLIKALLKQPVDKTPIWLMRQAGRYLPEYRKTRAKAGSFLTLCQTPELACEVTLQPLQRFDFDAAIIFSDILTIPHAMGLGLHFVEGEGPKFTKPITTVADITALPIPDMTDLQYVFDAIKLVRKDLDDRVPLIGFAGSPWTLACYMIEGGSSSDFQKIRKLVYQDPQSLHLLLNKLCETTILYLNEQIKAGAQVIMLFDTWGGILTTENYPLFSLIYMQKIISKLIKEQNKDPIPTIIFTRNAGLWLETIAETQCHCVSLDWSIDIGQAKQRIGHKVSLQGNLDPAVLLTNPDTIKKEAEKILTRMHGSYGHIFNLGHGITPEVNPDHVAALVHAVHEFKLSHHDLPIPE
jgi:uroporphyrinogen decarboxylase